MKKRLLSLLLVFTLMLGFIPTIVTADPGDLDLGVTYFDFNVPATGSGPNPDFESGNMGNDIGSVASTLSNADGYWNRQRKEQEKWQQNDRTFGNVMS